MADKELISKIKELKKIKPDKEWVGFCRSELLNRTQEAERVNWLNSFNQKVWQLMYQPAIAVVAVAFVFTTFGVVTTIAAKDSLPGDYAYVLKITYEEAQIKIASDEAKRTKIEAERVGRRADELAEIIKQSSPEKKVMVEKVVDQIESHLSTAQKDMSFLKEQVKNANNEDSAKIAEAAKAWQKNTIKISEVLEEAKVNLPENDVLASRISDISDIAGKTDADASEIIEVIEGAVQITDEVVEEIKAEGVEQENDNNEEAEEAKEAEIETETGNGKLFDDLGGLLNDLGVPEVQTTTLDIE